jgi:hypothetical protein
MDPSISVYVANCMQWDSFVEGERPSGSQATQKFYGRGISFRVFPKSATCPYPEPEEPNHSRDRKCVIFTNSVLGIFIQL